MSELYLVKATSSANTGDTVTASRASQPGIAPAANTTFSAPEPREAWNAGERAEVADVQERRILVVAPQPFYQDRGTPIAVRQVLEALSELGYPVDLLTFPVGLDVEIPGLEIIRAPNPFGIRRVPIGISPQKVLLDLGLDSTLRRQLRRRSYSCIHAVEEAAFLAVAAARGSGIPILYDMQSSLPEQLAQRPGFRLKPVHQVLNYAERWLLRRCDLVVASSGLASRVKTVAPEAVVREWKFPSAPVEASQDDVHALRARLDLPADLPLVVYSGTFEAYQGLPDLLAAIPLVRARVPAATFVLVGADGDSGLGEDTPVAALEASGALRVVARQPRSEMAPYLAMADVLVSPRVYGGNLPLKIFDYLAAGRAIVATDIPTHRTLLTEDRAVLAEPRPEALAAGIIELLEDRHRAMRLGHAARRFAERHLGWEAFVDSVADLYDEVHASARVRLV
jgi:glycosyltransferase involved in cell wall biosynthesis